MECQAKDLRTFLKLLDDRFPGEVLRVDTRGKAFDLAQCDAAAFLAKLKAGGKRPATLFRGFKTLSGKTWRGELLFSELSTLRKQAAALDLDGEVKFQELAQEFSRRNRLTTKPVKGLSLFDMPVYRKDEFDAKPGWLCAIGVGKEPDSGRYNLSWHRMHVHSPEHASARINPRHLMEYMNRYRAKGFDKMPVAFALGHHPAFEVAAGSNCAWSVDEYEFAGGLMDSPVRVTPSATLGEEFLIPADAEIVVEGMVDLNKKEICGPWADVMRYYSPQTLEPLFTPTAFLMRNDPICIGNWTGHDTYGVLGAASYVYSVLKERYPRVLAVNQVCPYTYVIQFKPRVPGESMRLALMALGSFADRIKNVILVDDDIDPFDLGMVMFAISTRTDADSAQIQIIRDLQANRQDPSTEKYLRVGGLIIDATKPVGKPFPDIGKPPDDALARIRLEDFVSAAELGKIAG
ncbi:MAG: UbiD family decarboxylase [Deltaproteobacteria bacterium]|nr:MAG: UbiD family decarboxylase [Deltaproteobacteria bacterium]